MKRNYPILTLIALLVVASLACTLSIDSPQVVIATPTPTLTQTPIPVSTQAAGDFINSIEQPTIDPVTGTATIVITEEELTSYVATQLKSDPNAFLRDPQISLENGEVVVHGTIITDVFSAPGSLAAEISVGPEGLPHATITSATVGGLPIPSPLLTQASGMIDKSIADCISNVSSSGYQIESITIANHQMTIVFKKK